MVRIVCIVNPAGRDGTVKKRWPKIAAQIEELGLDCEVMWTERTGHASEMAFSLRDRQDLDLVVYHLEIYFHYYYYYYLNYP